MDQLENKAAIKALITKLQDEHAGLEDRLVELLEKPVPDQLGIRRIKKQKLRLKDQIAKLEDMLFPDIIA